ncbi:MAG: hypothetical protein HN368_21570 [Spirochaetales bacterium]|nr:hypothetical protein [Spirochaetales bacterium]
MKDIESSEELTGYKAKEWKRGAFTVKGFTLVVPAKMNNDVPIFYEAVAADGRLERLKEASSVSPWLLGLGSWDEECKKHGSRYTICIEETKYTDFSEIEKDHNLFSFNIDKSYWLCFETTIQRFQERFWKDNPYKMLRALGYKFHMGSPGVGIHFDAAPPDFDVKDNPAYEFWITVVGPKTNSG